MKQKLSKIITLGLIAICTILPGGAFAQVRGEIEEPVGNLRLMDTDNDGLSNFEEINTYRTDPYLSDTDADGLSDLSEITTFRTDPLNPDTDSDSYKDGQEIANDYDPTKPAPGDKFPKRIEVSIKEQVLRYFIGTKEVGNFKISTGLKGHPTPTGEFEIQKKLPKVTYKGPDYYYPNTKWNLLFKYHKGGNYYIHGAYWHNSFGRPRSHGCVNVSYANMEVLYNWADEGTKVIIN